MEIDYKTVFSGIAVLISILSYDKAKRSLKLSKQQHEENKRLNVRQTLSTQYKDYVELYNHEYEKHKSWISDLSTLLNRTNSTIGDVFHDYDTRSENNSGKHARDIYYESYEKIMKAFQNELSWQTPENIKLRLNYYRNLNLNTNKDNVSLHDEDIQDLMYSLNKLVTNEEKEALFKAIINKLYTITLCFKQNEDLINSSVDALEKGLSKNKLEEFKLQENYELYRFYIQFLYLLKHIQKSPINYISKDKDILHMNISDIVIYGADMSIINHLILNVSFFTYET